jgi:hypothetical protein
MARMPGTARLLVLAWETASELRFRAGDAGVVASCAISRAALFPRWLLRIGEPPVR